jgi:hypothetical protein
MAMPEPGWRRVENQPDAEIGGPTGWERVDLGPVLSGQCVPITPTIWGRKDGAYLLYPGRCHSFASEPEGLKSWAAQTACRDELLAGRVVQYLDFEDTAEGLVDRLKALGVPAEVIAASFWYHRVDQPLGYDAADVLDAALASAGASLIVVDGVTEAMTLLGLNPYDNADVAKFWRVLPRRLSATGAAVILIDHVTKDREQRGRWAIGAQHKLAAIDGAAFVFEVLKPFGRGEQHGIARISLAKDRPGHLRQHAFGGVIAELHLQSWPDGGVDADILRPGVTDGNFRPTVLMERVSRYIEEHPGISKNGVATAVRGDDKAKRLAVELLGAEGFVTIGKSGASHILTSVRPFRNDEEEAA